MAKPATKVEPYVNGVEPKSVQANKINSCPAYSIINHKNQYHFVKIDVDMDTLKVIGDTVEILESNPSKWVLNDSFRQHVAHYIFMRDGI